MHDGRNDKNKTAEIKPFLKNLPGVFDCPPVASPHDTLLPGTRTYTGNLGRPGPPGTGPNVSGTGREDAAAPF